ncbi:MAG: hypothetical protein Q8L29_03950 [archaeon]|nr:hypothetical protein [archaeon]
MEQQTQTRTEEEQFLAGFERARNYVRENENALRKKYGNNYIAVLENIGVIDNDRDEFELARRMEAVHIEPQRVVLINTIDYVLNPRVVEISSLEVVRQR